jgi:hypothetical protein
MSREICENSSVLVKRGKKPTNQDENKVQQRTCEPAPDLTFDVRDAFEQDAIKCISDPKLRGVLRDQDFGWRPWVGASYRKIARKVAQQPTSRWWTNRYWDSLSAYLATLLDDKELGARFADLLMGYRLVEQGESPGRTYESAPTKLTNKKLPEFDSKQINRQFKKMSRLIGPFVRDIDALRLTISSLMANELSASGLPRSYICEEQIPKIWAAIEVKVKGESILRMERRRRQKQ